MAPVCTICATAAEPFLSKDGYDLSCCPSCGLVFVYPQPSLEYLRTKVYSVESGFQKGRVQDLSRYKPSKRYIEMYEMLQRNVAGGKVLDVGSGGGHFLYGLVRRGFNAEGIELNKRVADSARAQRLVVHDGTMNEVAFPPGSFDAVTMGELIEHVNDPRSLVRDAARALTPSGLMLITTPNIDCLWSRATLCLYRWFGIPWSTSTPPYHLFQFSASNLDLLLSQEGFERVTAKYLSPPTLKYEIGSLHLLKRFKASHNPLDLAYLTFAFALYIPLYGFCRLAHPFLKKDFSMLHLYRRKVGA